MTDEERKLVNDIRKELDYAKNSGGDEWVDIGNGNWQAYYKRPDYNLRAFYNFASRAAEIAESTTVDNMSPVIKNIGCEVAKLGVGFEAKALADALEKGLEKSNLATSERNPFAGMKF